jgi:hypothetical protein
MAHKNKPRRGPWKEWVYPRSEDVLKECEMKTIDEYIQICWQTIVVYVATRPIFNKCRQGEHKRGAVPHRWWWEQPMDLDVPDAPWPETHLYVGGGELAWWVLVKALFVWALA